MQYRNQFLNNETKIRLIETNSIISETKYKPKEKRVT